MFALWDCGSGRTGITFGFLIIRALFCPHLDTTKTPTERNMQEPNRARFERKSRVIGCMVFRRGICKNQEKTNQIAILRIIHDGLHDVSRTQQQTLTQRSCGQEASNYNRVQGDAVSIKAPLSENVEAPLCSAAGVKNVIPSSEKGKVSAFLFMAPPLDLMGLNWIGFPVTRRPCVCFCLTFHQLFQHAYFSHVGSFV